MARPKNTEQRRQQITRALLHVMAEHGYAKATIQAIAREAGLRPGLIHYHFKTKQAILVSLVGEVHEIGMARYRQRAEQTSTPAERLAAFIDARLAGGEDADPDAVAASVQAEYEKSIAAQKQLLCDILRDTAPGRAAQAYEHLAATVLATMEGAFQLSVAAKHTMPSAYAAKTTLSMVKAYLKSE